MRRLLGILTCVLLCIAAGGVVPAFAAGPDVDAAVCTTAGVATHTPIGPVPGPAAYAATLALSCTVAGSGDDGGNWTVTATAAGPLESCAFGQGNGTITGGASQFDGAVTGGGFTYVRTANVIHIVGTIFTALDLPGHPFTADLVYVPDVVGCPDGGAGTLTGTTELADGQTINIPDIDGAPCAVAANIAYGPPFVLNGAPVPMPFWATFVLNCLGVTDDAGLWAFPVTGIATSSCALETAAGAIGAGPAGGDGAITGGNVTWVRVGPAMELVATIFAAGETHHLFAHMAWNPAPGPVCGIPPTAGATAVGLGAIIDV